MFPSGTLIETPEGMFHVLGVISNDDYLGFFELDEEKSWYAPFCNLQQIERIFHPQNGRDVLLKKQVDSVLDNMRINRTFYKRYNICTNWDIERQFDDSLFDIFELALKNTDFYEKFKEIPCGMTYDSDANGQCIKTQYGNIITISAILKDFLYFMNIFYYGILVRDIPPSVMIGAQRIAIRIMLCTEALDFDMDSRGEVPKEIDEEVNTYVTWEILFVLAHEFSHSILGHLDDNNMIRCIDNNKISVIYNQSQKQEFEADIKAVKILGDALGYHNTIGATLKFFLALDLFEQAKEQIFPSINSYKTHPKAIERIRNIYDFFEESREYDVEKLLALNKKIKHELMEDISINMEEYEKYGSVYLGEWHKKMLRDRIDY